MMYFTKHRKDIPGLCLPLIGTRGTLLFSPQKYQSSAVTQKQANMSLVSPPRSAPSSSVKLT